MTVAPAAGRCEEGQKNRHAVTIDRYVYFGTNPTPGSAELLGTTPLKSWDLPRLQNSTTYYWQVVTRDANGAQPGPVWSFTTRS